MLKKVIIILVEGSSDEELLVERLHDLYKDCEIRFEIQNGDVFCNYQNAARHKSIKSVIGDIVKDILKKRKYKDSDILGILHIMDTDGCFIPRDNIVIDPSRKRKTTYELENIVVDSTKQQDNIIKRNEIKSKNVNSIYKEESLINKKYSYQLYYFSRTLEHVVFDEANPDNEDKLENIELFVESLECTIETFLQKHLPSLVNIVYKEKHRESWEHIKRDSNSLKKCSNVALLFEFIDNKLTK